MRKQLLATVILTGWAIFAPGSWMPVIHAQFSIASGGSSANTLTASSPVCTIRGANFRQHTYTVALMMGNEYTIDLVGTGPNNPGWDASLDAYLYLLNPTGQVVDENDDIIMGGGSAGLELCSRIAYNPPASGTYTIIVTTWAPIGYVAFDGTMPYKLTVAAQGIVGTSDGTLRPGQPNPAGTNYNSGMHSVNLTAGQTYTVDVHGENGLYDYQVDTVLYVVDPKGVTTRNDDYAEGGKSSRITFTATDSGLYKIYVTGWAPADTFSYHMTVTDSRAVTSETPVTPLGAGIPNVRLSPRPERLGIPALLLG